MKSKKKRLWMAVAIGIFALALMGGTLAYWVAEGPAVPIINTGSLDGELREVYDPPNKVYPGISIDKVVNVENTGDVDLIVRIRLEKTWGSSRGEDGKVIQEEKLSTDNIEIATDTEYWMYGDDGYYYYKGILEPGQTTLKPLFEAFEVSDTTDNEYKNKLADIVVSLECLQAGGNAIASWNMSYEALGVTESEAPQGITTKVTFVDPDGKFTFDPASTDLFDNFKDLVPGETRVQNIEIENTYEQAVEIFLRAEYVEQTMATTENIELVNEMLQKYATVTITDAEGKTVYKGPIWGNYVKESNGNDSMKDNISLGTYTTGERKDLTVTLTLDSSLDNKYQDLWGLVKWVFLAQGDEIEPGTDNPSTTGSASTTGSTSKTGSQPKTGDNSSMIFWIIGMAASIAALGTIIGVRLKKRNDIERQTRE